MGSPLSPTLANIYMENFEKEHVIGEQTEPTWWRYVDDVFTLNTMKEEEFKQ
jgi:hypothetical protein